MGFYKNRGTMPSRTASSREPVVIELTGEEQLNEIFEKLPEKWGKKPVLSTFRKGANAVRKQIRANFPQQIKSLSPAVGIKAGRGISLKVGIFGKKGYVRLKDGKDYDVYFPIYWFNYGTYAERASEHTFKQSRKSKSANRSGGITAQLFVEKSWEQTKKQAEQIINDELKNETLKFLKKHAVNN
jgi:hypothetical protein